MKAPFPGPEHNEEQLGEDGPEWQNLGVFGLFRAEAALREP